MILHDLFRNDEYHTCSVYDFAPCLLYFFFFQAEDGIRDHCVTGDQTCALPISSRIRHTALQRKSTRMNYSDKVISYAVFCLKYENSMLEVRSQNVFRFRIIFYKDSCKKIDYI